MLECRFISALLSDTYQSVIKAYKNELANHFKMKMSSRIITTLVIIIIFSTNQVQAQQSCNLPYCSNMVSGYQPNPFMLKGMPDPEICIAYPLDPQFPNLSQILLPIAQKSISSWNTEFIAVEANTYSLTEKIVQRGDSLSSCNVIIVFEKSELIHCTMTTQPYLPPCGSNTFNGITVPDINTGRATVFIPYLLDLNKECLYPKDNQIFRLACRSPTQLESDTSLFKAIQHELGHALGLGHYIAHTEQEAEGWIEGASPTPSIMVSGQDGNLVNAEVTLLDAKQVMIKYQNEIKTNSVVIPYWVKNTAQWWSQGQVSDSEFIKSIQYLVQNRIIQIPPTQTTSVGSQQIPQWVKNTSGWWATGQVSDDEFINAIQYLVSNEIISISN